MISTESLTWTDVVEGTETVASARALARAKSETLREWARMGGTGGRGAARSDEEGRGRR